MNRYEGMRNRIWLGAMIGLIGLAVCVGACSPTPSATPAPASSRTITVVMDDNYPPYTFLGSAGQPQGILIDEWALWSQKTGIRAEIHAMPWDEAQRRMVAGEFDVIDTLFYNDQRAQLYDFTPPYARVDVPIYFTNRISGITDAASLKGFTVAAKAGDSALNVLRQQGITQIQLFDSYAAIVQAAQAGQVTVFVMDQPPAQYYLYKLGLQDQFNATAPLYTGELHRAVKKGNTALLNTVEQGFAQISPAESAAIERKWFGSPAISSAIPWRAVGVGIGIAGLIVLILVAWNVALQRAVAHRTRELHNSQQRLQAVFDAVNDAIFVHDPATGAILDANQTACEMFGYASPEAARHFPVAEFGTGERPYTPADLLEWMRKAADGEPQLFEWQARRLDGHGLWLEANMRLARSDGRDRILVATRDISGRKREQAALAESEMRLRQLGDNLPGGMTYQIEVGADGEARQFTYVSAGVQKLHGLPAQAVLDNAQLLYDQIVEADRPLVAAQEAQTLAAMANFEAEVRFRLPSGEIRWGLLASAPRRAPSGRVLWDGIELDITERKQAEAALQGSEARYRGLFEDSPISLAEQDLSAVKQRLEALRAEGVTDMRAHLDAYPETVTECLRLLRITDVNRAALDLYGASRKAELLSGVDRFVPPEALAAFRAELVWLAEGRTAFAYETVNCRLSGERLDIHLHLSAAPGCEESLSRVIVSILDITARKQAEVSLRASEERLRLATRAGHIGIWDFDCRRNQLVWDDSTYALYGLCREEFPDAFEAWRRVQHPDDRVRVEAERQAALRGERPYAPEFRIVRPDGRIRTIQSESQTFYAPDGSPLRQVGTNIDITEQKLAEAKLREYQEDLEELVRERTGALEREVAEHRVAMDRLLDTRRYLEQVFNTNPDAAVILRMADSTFIVNVNDGFSETVGFTREEVVGKTTLELGLWADPADSAAILELLERIGACRDVEAVFNTKDGRQFVGLVSGRRFYYETVPHLVIYVHDITRRKQIEMELQRAKDEADAANQAKTLFLANMGHELRSPLHTILLAAEALSGDLYGEPAPEQRASLQAITESSQHLLALTNDLLDLSKFESGKASLLLGLVPVAEVCQAALRLISVQVLKKHLRVTTQIDVQAGVINADGRRLKQMLVNLLTNAVKFTPDGGQIGLQVTPYPDRQCLEFTVWDTGVGIAAADQAKLFRPFVQLDNRITRDQSGTGLGLALVRSVAELHGGRVSLQSEPGRGSRFTIALPWQPDLMADLTAAVSEVAAPVRSPTRGAAGSLILLADDNELAAGTVADFLTAQGFQVVVAHDGQEAVDVALAQRPAAILMDVQMPNMDGLEATEVLRARPETAGTPILMFTALADARDRERCLAAGASDYLSKPVRLAELKVRLDQWLSGGGPGTGPDPDLLV